MISQKRYKGSDVLGRQSEGKKMSSAYVQGLREDSHNPAGVESAGWAMGRAGSRRSPRAQGKSWSHRRNQGLRDTRFRARCGILVSHLFPRIREQKSYALDSDLWRNGLFCSPLPVWQRCLPALISSPLLGRCCFLFSSSIIIGKRKNLAQEERDFCRERGSPKSSTSVTFQKGTLMVPLSTVHKELSPQPQLDTEQSSEKCSLSCAPSRWPCASGLGLHFFLHHQKALLAKAKKKSLS